MNKLLLSNPSRGKEKRGGEEREGRERRERGRGEGGETHTHQNTVSREMILRGMAGPEEGDLRGNKHQKRIQIKFEPVPTIKIV